MDVRTILKSIDSNTILKSIDTVGIGSLWNYLWIFFSEHSDGEQVFFVSEENSDIIFEIELEDR